MSPMRQWLLVGASAAFLASASAAQQPPPAAGAMPPPPPRAPGPSLRASVAMAQAAIARCRADGYKVLVLVTDSAGVPVAMLSDDGAAARAQQVVPTKVATTLRYGVASGDIVERAKSDAALQAEVAADPKIGVVRAGALPLMEGGKLLGVIAVGGAPGGEKDVACALPAIAAQGGKFR